MGGALKVRAVDGLDRLVLLWFTAANWTTFYEGGFKVWAEAIQDPIVRFALTLTHNLRCARARGRGGSKV